MKFKLFIYVFIIFITLFACRTTNTDFQSVKNYLSKDLNQTVENDDIFVILSIDMCYTCLHKHFISLNSSPKLLNVILVGNSVKNI